MRLAWFSPLPPIPSGIADYSAELLPLIAEGADVHVYSPRPSLTKKLHVPRGVAVYAPRSFQRRANLYDVLFYHLGNNPYHEYVYRAATERPGIAVFHEIVLHHLIASLYAERRPDWRRYRAMLTEELGEIGSNLAKLRMQGIGTGTDLFMFPLNGHIAASARAIVVHSQEAREEMADVAPGVPTTVIPHHAGTPPAQVEGLSREAARAQLGLPADVFIVAQFGFITRAKQPAAVARGFARFVERFPDALLLLVGENQAPGQSLERLMDSMGVSHRVRVIGFVDLCTFYRYLKAADVVVNLRYPSAGEASGTFARALAEGRAVIASNLGSFAEVPPDVVLKVEVDGDQTEELSHHLIRLAEDPGFKDSLEKRARHYALTVLDPSRCARLYLEVARSVAGERIPFPSTPRR
jgi:glycosyltransferase involved in cell wall biosynthesis